MAAGIVLASLKKEAEPLFKQINKLVITDGESYNLKSAKVDALKQLGKMAAEKEKTFTEPLTKLLKDVRELFAPFKYMVGETENAAKAEMLEYITKVERQKEKIKTDLEAGKIAKLSTAVRKTAELEINSPSSSIRKVWVLEINDIGDIPREYLVPDEAKIREAFKAGKKVSGCTWSQKNTIAI